MHCIARLYCSCVKNDISQAWTSTLFVYMQQTGVLHSGALQQLLSQTEIFCVRRLRILLCTPPSCRIASLPRGSPLRESHPPALPLLQFPTQKFGMHFAYTLPRRSPTTRNSSLKHGEHMMFAGVVPSGSSLHQGVEIVRCRHNLPLMYNSSLVQAGMERNRLDYNRLQS